MSESEMNEKVSIDWPAALRWSVGSAVANAVIAMLFSFWLGTPGLSIVDVVSTSVIAGVLNAGTVAQMIPWQGRLRPVHWLGVAVIAGSLGCLGRFFVGGDFLNPALTYSAVAVLGGVPTGYAAMQYLASRPVAPEGHPDNLDSY